MDKPSEQQYGNFTYFSDKKEIPMLAGEMLASVMQGALDRGVSYGEMEDWVFTVHPQILNDIQRLTLYVPGEAIGTIAVKSTPKKFFIKEK